MGTEVGYIGQGKVSEFGQDNFVIPITKFGQDNCGPIFKVDLQIGLFLDVGELFKYPSEQPKIRLLVPVVTTQRE